MIPIIYEDNHLLVVEKPVNMPTQEDNSGDMDLLNALKADLKQRYQKPGNVYLGMVHRLDRPVGGVMVFAKTSKAASRLSNAIRLRTFQKSYLAVVHGNLQEKSSKLVHYLSKNEKENKVYAVSKGYQGAKEAILEYNVKAEMNNLSLVHVQLHTGRPHQIRIQFATIGHPLYGDQKYGAKVNVPGQQIALWSTHIGLEHPTLKETMNFYNYPIQHRTYPWTLWEADFYNGLS